ncbi:glycosyltransferase family 4 protein (plasmid) [Deinococcus taeanensis]|uniref:glycosyltransferase family 4 protein n=1 Tax=Deinococcus taeanensis TaxID=2737050 RepID=UPI001CDD7362|nr:glycosyltransferase family 4 protein [Deinococcus taeanensis]UBV44312.1 glycosyltransferase family 4 protein [Deinococcus taeanensis]
MYRLIGIDNEGSVDYRVVRGRNLSVYRALGPHAQVVGRFTPALSHWAKYSNYALSFRPDPWHWKGVANLNPRTFRAQSALALQRLRARRAEFDVTLQIFGMFSVAGQGFPVALYLDNTMALTLQHYPQWNPMSRRERQEWLILETEAYRAADVIFTMSGAVQRSVIDDYGVPAGKVVTVGAGTNFTLDGPDKQEYGQQTALFVAYEFGRNGGEVLLDAWRQVRAALPGARLQIVGPRHRVAPPGMPGVEWYGPVRNRMRLRQLFEDATVFVLPSLFNPFPHVLREAMALGLPCVSTAHAAIPEIVTDGHNGALVPVRDPDALAGALITLLSDPDLARQYGQAGRAAVSRAMSWEQVGAAMAPGLAALAAHH